MFSLHRDWIEDMSKPIGPGVRGRALLGKNFVPGAYAEELRRMKQRRAEFDRMDAALRRAPAADHAVPAIPLGEVEETSPIPGYLTRPGNYLGLCGLVDAQRPVAAACRSASRSSASPTPSATC